MAVHAHPDDEAIGTGGILARYSAEGARTVLVTCTNGEQGDGAGGVKPGEESHDPAEVAAVRLSELRTAAGILGISDLELLGYRDSGMVGWAANTDPNVFCNVPLDVAAARISHLLKRYRPQVVVTYDDNGGYGHPDHIQAHRATMAAVEMAAAEDATGTTKVYYTALPKSAVATLREQLVLSGADLEGQDFPEDFGTPDELVTTEVDVSGFVGQKIEALNAHSSQTENFFLNRLGEDLVAKALSREWFTLRSAPPGFGGETDLFAGVR